MTSAVLTVRLAADGVTVAFDIPLDPAQITRLTGPHCFRRDEVLDHLVRNAFSHLDIALRRPAKPVAQPGRDDSPDLDAEAYEEIDRLMEKDD